MIKIAVVGAGRMANAHTSTLRDHFSADCELYSVYDPVEKVAKEFAERYKMKKICSSLAEVANDKAVDAVLVCNYSDQHYDTLTELLNAGKKYIFCEKALVRELKDGEELLKKAEKAGAVITVGHHRRYIAGYKKLKQLVESGELGRIRMAKVALSHPAYTRQWGEFFSDFGRSGGVTLDMMTHMFDQLNWYFGDAESVSAESLMFDASQPLPVDFVAGTLRYKNGVICSIECSWQRYGVGYDKVELYGDKACAIFENGEKVDVYRPGEHTEIFTKTEGGAHKGQMANFIATIKDGTKPGCSLLDGFKSAEVSLKMIEAAEKHKVVKL